MKTPVILLFRKDLRLHDNAALAKALASKCPIIPVYIHDAKAGNQDGSMSKWWLHKSLIQLDLSLGNKLNFFKSSSYECLKQIIQETGAEHIFAGRMYDPHLQKIDDELEKNLAKKSVKFHRNEGYLLKEPQLVKKSDGDDYKIFTPYYKKNYAYDKYSIKQPKSFSQKGFDEAKFLKLDNSLDIDALELMPKKKWHQKLEKFWKPGEQGAHERFEHFLNEQIKEYKLNRNRPDLGGTSLLSPHLHFGEISVRYIWHKILDLMDTQRDVDGHNHFLSEICWREFSYYILHYFPQLQEKNWKEKFDKVEWLNDEKALKAWQMGQTGYPIVDAGMRELWQTGFMHNRLRMICGSFLVKHLLIDWRRGAEWFWDCLVDADIANNSSGWQWVTGSGADASPYFRIFNPIIQGEKFDPDGNFTRKYVPEIAKLPTKYLFKPWEISEQMLQNYGIELGKTYPKPIIDHKQARTRALNAYNKTKEN